MKQKMCFKLKPEAQKCASIKIWSTKNVLQIKNRSTKMCFNKNLKHKKCASIKIWSTKNVLQSKLMHKNGASN